MNRMIQWKKNRSYDLLTIGLVMAALVAGCGERDATGTGHSAPTLVAAEAQQETRPAAPASSPVVQTPATRDAVAMQNAFAAVAKAVQPAVVTITTQRRLPPPARMRGGPSPFGGPDPFGGRDPFEEFFRRFRGFGPGSLDRGAEEGARPRLLQGGPPRGGLGSGLIYSADGLIMTNAHVVRGADTVTVTLADGREFKRAKVLGQDARTDVAVVKIEATGLPTVQMGDSSAVRVGDWAIAVGNPFGLEHTLTVGVISAKAREVALSEAGPGDYLQTDASINPGNSGGPLLDIYGRAIGVNNAIYSQTGGNVGIGFAIPINTAREIADILVKEGRVRRARLGIAISDVSDQAAFGLDPNTKGALVGSVDPNGPGARAGLQPGDVVVAFNGKPITRSLELQRLVSTAPIGSNVELKVRRGGKTITVTARLEELKETGTTARPGAPSEPEGGPTALGLGLAPLTPSLAQRYGIQATKGVVVVGVQQGSPAAATGIQPGDVIERVGQTAVSTPQEVQAAVKSILGRQSGQDRSVALYVNRRGERRFVIVSVSQ